MCLFELAIQQSLGDGRIAAGGGVRQGDPHRRHVQARRGAEAAQQPDLLVAPDAAIVLAENRISASATITDIAGSAPYLPRFVSLSGHCLALFVERVAGCEFCYEPPRRVAGAAVNVVLPGSLAVSADNRRIHMGASDPLVPPSALLPLVGTRCGGQRPIQHVPGSLRPFSATLAVIPPRQGKHRIIATRCDKTETTQRSRDGVVEEDSVVITQTDS